MPFEQIKITYEHDHNCKIEDKFEWVEKEAIGAASLAQVHKAKLKETGEIVVIKIQYPKLRLQTNIDLKVIRILSRLANKMCRYYEYTGIDFAKFMQHFEKGLMQELDFKQEVINSIMTSDNFRGQDELYIPKTMYLDSTKRTIVMEYIEGDRIDELEKLKEKYGSAQEATDLLVQIFAKMIFEHGHIHCDAHPGNILVRPHPLNPKKPQIVLLDHGFYAKTSDDFRKSFCNLWHALCSFDY